MSGAFNSEILAKWVNYTSARKEECGAEGNRVDGLRSLTRKLKPKSGRINNLIWKYVHGLTKADELQVVLKDENGVFSMNLNQCLRLLKVTGCRIWQIS